MTMKNLHKQNNYQWIAIVIIGFMLVLESQSRIDYQTKNMDGLKQRVERDYEEYCRIGARLIETTPSKMEIMPSCLVDVTIHPKHSNHKH